MAEPRVYKYSLGRIGLYISKVKINLPADAQVLSVGVQLMEMQLWALVDPEAPITTREFALVGTGVLIGELGRRKPRFIGTVQTGGYVWHVFELVDPETQD